MQHIFLIGAKSFGGYGGYETFIDKLTEYHQNDCAIKYHVAVKKNGIGSKIPDYVIKKIGGYEYHNADCFEIPVPEWLKSAQAVYYDCAALSKAIEIIVEQKIEHPIIYVMACRIGPFFSHYVNMIKDLGGKIYLNPDGHEWLRSKWSTPIKIYWKYSEKKMIMGSDLIVCDSINIKKYIESTYKIKNTTYISYGSETVACDCDDSLYRSWLKNFKLKQNEYYLVVCRFVPENNFETIIMEYMKSHTTKSLVIITNNDDKLMRKIKQKTSFDEDNRIKFVGALYDRKLLAKIREEAYGYIHGHEVGGTNPSLLEALAYTKLNLLYKICFNEEVGVDAVLYWTKEDGDLSSLIDNCETINRDVLAAKAKERIKTNYSWNLIADSYAKIWNI